ncbi:hypothetical protein [Hazenella coriacea]|uniref:Uncharacterized protein n=1 Tax=Hazenella coriacea TaxID=1179467 RepID=A0A4R3LC01_9BACL|nr:hypothetical protein [Hazenella coriacea]TCS96770.1 hypothetical protein EDD58_101411 [Hazenella coriacea]
MIRIEVTGEEHHVRRFLYEIQCNPSIQLDQQETDSLKNNGQADCHVTYKVVLQPEQRTRLVEIQTTEGKKIQIPILDLIQVEIDEGVKVLAGKTIDIFT